MLILPEPVSQQWNQKKNQSIANVRRYGISVCGSITKTCLYNFDPHKPLFYVVKLGFTRVCIISLISAQRHNLWYALEPPLRGGSNAYPQSMFWAEILRMSDFFVWKFSFLVVKFSVYLNRRVFVMQISNDMIVVYYVGINKLRHSVIYLNFTDASTLWILQKRPSVSGFSLFI